VAVVYVTNLHIQLWGAWVYVELTSVSPEIQRLLSQPGGSCRVKDAFKRPDCIGELLDFFLKGECKCLHVFCFC